jgi:hypothetical protein
MEELRVVFVPGNGGFDTSSDIWYPYLIEEFEALGMTVIVPGVYPDQYTGHMNIWLPYIINEV